jgi:hypothetical protein
VGDFHASPFMTGEKTPCETSLCTQRLRKKCEEHSCSCLAWNVYIRSSKIDDSKIGVFRNSVCDKCKKEKSDCENKCHLRRA